MAKQEIIKIFASYQWTNDAGVDVKLVKEKNKITGLAIQEIIKRVRHRIDTFQRNHPDVIIPNLFYSRLRATSGTFVFESIRQRITNSYAIIFDITNKNPNVMLELGIALELQRHIEHPAKVFLIAHAESFYHDLLPSDLKGYFLTTYWAKNDTSIVFGDSGSLVMRITSDIMETIKAAYVEDPMD